MSEFLWPIRVYYEDTDSGGVVYHANYLKFMERARSEWLRSLGYEQDGLLEKYGVIFAVRWAEIDFHSPARFNEQLQVSSKIAAKGRASLVFQQQITIQGEKRLICSGKVRVACIDTTTFRPCRIPDPIFREIIDAEL